jgi:hypothetical protein
LSIYQGETHMINKIKTICLCIVLSIVVNILAYSINSTFIKTYLDENLLTLLIALLAINTTTLSVILTKLKDISDKHKINFASSVKEMKMSIIEQVIVIILGLLFQVVQNSTDIMSLHQSLPFIFSVLVLLVFIYAIDILIDTANGIFVILDYENKK